MWFSIGGALAKLSQVSFIRRQLAYLRRDCRGFRSSDSIAEVDHAGLGVVISLLRWITHIPLNLQCL